MRNRDKYQLTNDAIEAWDKYHDGGGDMPFDKWLKCEFEDPSAPTLQEAAEALVKEFYRYNIDRYSFERCMERLSEAVKSEKAKPVRNCDRYKTAEEAYYAIYKMCYAHNCKDCRFKEGGIPCRFLWLYEEAEKDEAK